MIINSYLRSYKMNIITVRANNIYGPRQHIEKPYHIVVILLLIIKNSTYMERVKVKDVSYM